VAIYRLKVLNNFEALAPVLLKLQF